MKILCSIMALLLPAAAVCECPLSVPAGNHHVMLTAYYSHQDPTRTDDPYTFTYSRYYVGPGEATAEAEGHPVAFEWWLDGVSVQTCGEIPWPDSPDRIFRDGFEVGDTSRWTAVIAISSYLLTQPFEENGQTPSTGKKTGQNDSRELSSPVILKPLASAQEMN